MAYEKPNRYPCPFCEVFSQRIPSVILFKNELAVAFMAVNKRSVGAVMVSPIRHVEEIASLTVEEAKCVMALIQKAGKAVIDTFKPDGLHVFCNAGKRAGQSVCHMHVQIQTRFYDVDYAFDPAIKLPWIPVQELRQSAAKILQARPSPNQAVNFNVPVEASIFEAGLASEETIVLESTANFTVAIPPKTRTKGALVIAPKKKIQNIFLLEESEYNELILLMRKYCQIIEEVYDPIGLSTWCETGEVADQFFSHFLVEIVPYHKDVDYKYQSRKTLATTSVETRRNIQIDLLNKKNEN